MNVLDCTAIVARRILVVAPHPDDESLGCGGLIATLGPLGARFHTIFVTDGGASHASPTWSRERLRDAREAEAAAALARLGIADAPRSFLRHRDADMPAPGTPGFAAAVESLGAVLAGFVPDLALLPWRRDPHRDHRDSFALVSAALATLPERVPTLEYAIWLDELGAPQDHPLPNEIERVGFDISAVLPLKRAAVAAHLTQTSDLIPDDPDAFRLTPATIDRLTGPVETYFRPLS